MSVCLFVCMHVLDSKTRDNRKEDRANLGQRWHNTHASDKRS